MKVLFAVVVLSLLASLAFALDPEVKPTMIEISLDGGDFTEASAYVSDIDIVIGVVLDPNASVYITRGVVVPWMAQLGTPCEDRMVKWKLATALLPVSAKKFMLRFKWALGETESVYSEVSDEIILIEAGKPGKPTIIILN